MRLKPRVPVHYICFLLLAKGLKISSRMAHWRFIKRWIRLHLLDFEFYSQLADYKVQVNAPGAKGKEFRDKIFLNVLWAEGQTIHLWILLLLVYVKHVKASLVCSSNLAEDTGYPRKWRSLISIVDDR